MFQFYRLTVLKIDGRLNLMNREVIGQKMLFTKFSIYNIHVLIYAEEMLLGYTTRQIQPFGDRKY